MTGIQGASEAEISVDRAVVGDDMLLIVWDIQELNWIRLGWNGNMVGAVRRMTAVEAVIVSGTGDHLSH